MSQGQYATFQQQRTRGDQLDYEGSIKLYGPLVFDTAMPLFKELVSRNIPLFSDYLRHIEEHAGQEFAKKVGELKGKIQDTVSKEHGGPFDDMVKRVVRENFGPTTDFAMEYGDWAETFFHLVLRHQAVKMKHIFALEAALNREVNHTRAAVKHALADLEQWIPTTEAELAKDMKNRPNPMKFDNFAEGLKAQTVFDNGLKSLKMRLDGVQKAVRWFNDDSPKGGKKWLDNKKQDETPPSKKDVLLEQIADLMEQITGLKAEEADAAGKSEYGIAGQKKNGRLALETKVHEIETEIAQLDAVSKSTDSETGTTTPAPGTGAPMGAGPKVTGDAEQAKKAAGDVAAKVETYKAEITRLETEVVQHEKKVPEKEAEAVKKSAEARAETDDEKAEVMLRDARLLRQGAKASAEAAEKRRKEIAELTVELERLAKAVEPPKAEAKKKKAAKTKPTETSTSEPPVVETSGKTSTTEPVVAAEDKPPKLTGDQRADAVARLNYWMDKGNAVMVEGAMIALKALGG